MSITLAFIRRTGWDPTSLTGLVEAKRIFVPAIWGCRPGVGDWLSPSTSHLLSDTRINPRVGPPASTRYVYSNAHVPTPCGFRAADLARRVVLLASMSVKKLQSYLTSHFPPASAPSRAAPARRYPGGPALSRRGRSLRTREIRSSSERFLTVLDQVTHPK